MSSWDNGQVERLQQRVREQEDQIKLLQGQIDEELQARVARVRKALLDEGTHPPYHRRQVERLRQEWPIMYNAIMHLVKP